MTRSRWRYSRASAATPKWLPSKLFYDEIGSGLFEQITELPEYYLTRTERSILESYAGEIVEQAGTSLTLVELGAGTATKTCILIEELLSRQSRALFYPIDVSPSALAGGGGATGPAISRVASQSHRRRLHRWG